MEPRLVIISGSRESEKFNLEDKDIFSIGRAVKNHLAISDYGLSREHALISKSEDGYIIEDNSSQNGTFVNEIPIQKQQLKNGDLIRVGQTTLLFLTTEKISDKHFSDHILFDEDTLLTQSFVRLNSDKSKNNLTDLAVLTNIGRLLNEVEDSVIIQKRLLEIILEMIPAERGAFVLLDDDSEMPHSVTVLDTTSHSDDPMKISRTVTNQVLGEEIAILINNIYENKTLNTESIISSGINSILCVPLKLGEIQGVIYLDSSDIMFRFEEHHLQQMTAVSYLVAASLKNIHYIEVLKKKNKNLQNLANIKSKMVGDSPQLELLKQQISKVSSSNANVLIIGESGTGKELVARSVFENSIRLNKDFVIVNCAVLEENLLASDLFGHERGAFTGAIELRLGKIELANGGTLFLDEIGELALPLQARLLRVLQERQFERMGGNKTIHSSIRLIAATNRNLDEEVKNGNFREDLFYRLNVVQLSVPPLRERKTDIPILIEYFTKKYAEECNKKISGLTREAQNVLIRHIWRGNIRELENVIESAVVFSYGGLITIDDLPEYLFESNKIEINSPNGYHQQVKDAKCNIIINALKKSNGNYTEAAKELNILPNNLHRLIRDLDIKDETKNI